MDFFKATVRPDKKLFREAGDAFAQSNKRLKFLLIWGLVICLIVGPVLTYFCRLTHYGGLFVIPTLGIILIFYYYFSPKSLGNQMYKSQSKKNLTKETTYYFSDSDFRAETVDASSVASYSAIEALYETDGLYCLYVNKTSAFLIPKNCIENPLCDPKTFLESKVGQKFIFVKKKSAGKAAAKIIGIFAAGIILTLAAFIVADFQLDEPQTFSYEDYSVTLDKHFVEWEENQIDDYSLTSDDVTFLLDKYTQKDAKYAFDSQDINVEKIVNVFSEEVDMLDKKQTNRYNYIIKYNDEYEGVRYYNAVCIQQVGRDYWITQLYCEGSLREDYEELFDKWISSIKYGAEQKM